MSCDSIILRAVDTTFDLVWRHKGQDTTLATWSEHWEPLPGGVYDAQPYTKDIEGTAIDFSEGDQFIFRYTGTNSESAAAYIPNGDGERTKGTIPNITFPR